MDDKHIEYPVINGKYKHYKGGMYQFITMAKHSENNELLVIYKSLHFGSIHARPLDSWNSWVLSDDEETQIKRFELVV